MTYLAKHVAAFAVALLVTALTVSEAATMPLFPAVVPTAAGALA